MVLEFSAARNAEAPYFETGGRAVEEEAKQRQAQCHYCPENGIFCNLKSFL